MDLSIKAPCTFGAERRFPYSDLSDKVLPPWCSMTSTKGTSWFDGNSRVVKNDALVSSQYCLFLVGYLKRVELLIWARSLIPFHAQNILIQVYGQPKMRLHRYLIMNEKCITSFYQLKKCMSDIKKAPKRLTQFIEFLMFKINACKNQHQIRRPIMISGKNVFACGTKNHVICFSRANHIPAIEFVYRWHKCLKSQSEQCFIQCWTWIMDSLIWWTISKFSNNQIVFSLLPKWIILTTVVTKSDSPHDICTYLEAS